jgi:hypothetical protein
MTWSERLSTAQLWLAALGGVVGLALGLGKAWKAITEALGRRSAAARAKVVEQELEILVLELRNRRHSFMASSGFLPFGDEYSAAAELGHTRHVLVRRWSEGKLHVRLAELHDPPSTWST